jgi:nucleoside-diphosphate-sugar epimerase
MAKNGWEVACSFRKGSHIYDLPEGARWVLADDIEDHNYLPRDFEGVDAVVHLAGRAHITNGTSANQLEAFRRVNVSGTARLARAAAKAGVRRFVYISSIKVNGEGRQSPYSEEDVPDPVDPYGISKYEAEQALAAISVETGIGTVILRPPLVYGPGVKANFESLIRVIDYGLPLPFKNIDNRRSYIYISNLTDAILLSVSHPKAAGEIFIVSDCEDISTPDLIRSLASAMGKKASLFSLHPAIIKAMSSVLGKREEIEKLMGSLFVNAEKIKDRLGWKPPFTLKEGIEETVRQHKLR